MRILYSVHGYKPAYRIGGPILSVSAAAERLAQRGHQVAVFTTNSNLDQDLDVPTDRPIDVNGVEVWYFRRREVLKRFLPFVPYLTKSLGFLYCPAMASHLRRLVPQMDVVHAQLPFIYPTYAAAKAARIFGKPFFYHQRGVLDPERMKFRAVKKRLYFELVERKILQNATTLIALTQAELESYRALGIQTPCRIIPNGIEINDYRPQMAPGQVRWNFPANATVVLFMARLHPIKGADKLLQAFLQVHARFPQARLVMAGPDEFGLEASFRDAIQKAGLTDRVLFPGMVSGQDKINLLARSDLFCLPSDAEGFSMAVLEAMASSTAVLLSPGCHFPEVELAGAGLTVPATRESLAAALTELLGQPQRLRQMGAAGRELVTSRYSWDHIVDQLEEAYWDGVARCEAKR